MKATQQSRRHTRTDGLAFTSTHRTGSRRGGGGGAMGVAHGPAGGAGPGAMSRGFAAPGTFNRAGPTTFNRAPINGPIGRTGGNWANNNWHHGDHHHHAFHNRNFFAFGFGGGPYYDYAYDSCWAQAPTPYGWQWVNVCGDYGY